MSRISAAAAASSKEPQGRQPLWDEMVKFDGEGRMITIETQISGNQIGSKLADDPEELGYCLVALCEDFDPRDLDEVVDCTSNAHLVGPFLRKLADAIDPPKETPHV